MPGDGAEPSDEDPDEPSDEEPSEPEDVEESGSEGGQQKIDWSTNVMKLSH